MQINFIRQNIYDKLSFGWCIIRVSVSGNAKTSQIGNYFAWWSIVANFIKLICLIYFSRVVRNQQILFFILAEWDPDTH